MIIENQLITEIKPIIERGDLNKLKNLWNEYIETDFGRDIAWDYIFQKVYLHAALKKQKHICDWFDILFTQLNPVNQIALRQMFSYAKYLLNKD